LVGKARLGGLRFVLRGQGHSVGNQGWRPRCQVDADTSGKDQDSAAEYNAATGLRRHETLEQRAINTHARCHGDVTEVWRRGELAVNNSPWKFAFEEH
jgi:hypothetical protein